MLTLTLFSELKNVSLRRVLAKDSETQEVVKDIGDIYTDFGYHGIRTPTTDLATLTSAPPAGRLDRRKWESLDPELGPTGLILSTVFRMGAGPGFDNDDYSPAR